MSMHWRALAVCWLVVIASCASDGGQRGTGITAAAGNVARVEGGAADVADIEVTVEGTELRTTTDATGAFVLRGDFEGDTALRFVPANDGATARLTVNAPAGGRIDARDVVVDTTTGIARASAVGVAFEGQIEMLACAAERVTLTSVHRTPDDLDTYDVALAGSTLHAADGTPLRCVDLRVGDRLDVDGVFASDGTIADADLTRR